MTEESGLSRVNMSLSDKKKVFAIELASSPSDPLEAAVTAHDGDRGMALACYMDWYNDAEIRAYMKSHTSLTGDDDEETPSQKTIIKDIYRMTKGRFISDKDKLAAYQAICDIEGYIQPKHQTNIQVNTNVQKNVMTVESFGSDDQWKLSLKEQQAKLMDSSKDPEAQDTIDAYAKDKA